MKTGFYDVLPFYWLPEAGPKKRERRDGMPYRTWADQGFLELCDGNVIDYREVKARLIWGVQTFDRREICFDPYNSRQLSTQLIDEGYECVEIRQGYATLSEPSKKSLIGSVRKTSAWRASNSALERFLSLHKRE